MINFVDAEILNYTQQNRFFGAGVRYGVQKNISVQGNIDNYTNSSGVSGIHSGINAILSGSTDYDEIILNGESWGRGKINSISFDPNNEVRNKPYTANITVFESGNTSNLSGFYSGINYESVFLLDSFSEDISYSKSADATKSYTHSVNLRFHSGVNLTGTPIDYAKNFASQCFSHTNLTGFLGQYLSTSTYKKRSNESYNLITNDCAFSQSYDFSDVSGAYSIIYSHSVQTDENGITNVNENGSIEGLVAPYWENALSGYQVERNNTFDRCSGVFEFYKPIDAYPLNTNAISQQATLDKLSNNISYQVQFTNNPNLLDLYRWAYTQEISRKQDQSIEVSENGTILGFGKRGTEQYNNALYGWGIVETGIPYRLGVLYSGESQRTNPLYLISEAETKSQFAGLVEYSETYSDNSALVNESGIKKSSISVTDQMPTRIINSFNIVNEKELIQDGGISKLGVRQVNINLLGEKLTEYTGYVQYAKQTAAPYLPTGLGEDVYVQSVNYRFNEKQNTFNFDLSWIFHNDSQTFSGINIV